jgi:hypothetical protein
MLDWFSFREGAMQWVGRAAPDGAGEVRAFMIVRDEALRLPAVLAHHRALGVDRFIVLDDRSRDGTIDLLLAQPDVHVLHASGTFAGSRGGLDWVNAMLDAYGQGGWSLVVDADELFVFPDFETVGLRALCGHLEARDARALLALMIDMYGAGEIGETVHEPACALIETAPWFDPGPYRAFRTPEFPHLQAVGGPRERVFDFSPYQSRPPVLTKIPLVRWSAGMRFLMSTHTLTPTTLPPLMAGLLHFKFLSDFPVRVEAAVAAGQHYGGAREYRAYQDRLREDPRLRLHTDASVRYRDSRQLVAQGLMHVDAAYEAFVAAVQAR